jgi:hypothetical protein
MGGVFAPVERFDKRGEAVHVAIGGNGRQHQHALPVASSLGTFERSASGIKHD